MVFFLWHYQVVTEKEIPEPPWGVRDIGVTPLSLRCFDLSLIADLAVGVFRHVSKLVQ